MYVSDGYGNRRVVIVDAATGKYLGHFGAYGNNPIDDKAAAAAGIWMNDLTKGKRNILARLGDGNDIFRFESTDRDIEQAAANDQSSAAKS